MEFISTYQKLCVASFPILKLKTIIMKLLLGDLSIIGRGDWLAVKVCWVLQVIPTSYQLNAVPYLLFKAVIDQRTFGSSKHTFF